MYWKNVYIYIIQHIYTRFELNKVTFCGTVAVDKNF